MFLRHFVRLVCFLSAITGFAQIERKEVIMQRCAIAPTIDGILSDLAWQTAPLAKDFVMLNPGNGQKERGNLKSEVKLVFDDDYIYISARLFDAHPDSILTELSPRDVYTKNNDYFGISINPFNDGISDFNFWVTAAGVQADSRTTVDGNDFGWNTVWFSAVNINSFGWTVEMAIPYQSLRYSKEGNGIWGLNMVRYIRRSREEYSWNFIDRSFGNPEQFCGLMSGMNGIKPPVRLSFLPYASSYANVYENQTDVSYNLGMDVKYGISESFTLDATLVPDFGQVAFDNQQLNLTPFELQFEENRPFFNEGVDLFNKGNLFYSRRIGGTPKNVTNANSSDTSLSPSLPEYTRLINATKISGRNSRNLGVGFFNAVTDNNYQEYSDGEGNVERVLIEPLTNYNIIVLDQRFNQNSSVSFINTNTLRSGSAHDANVSGLISSLTNKSNSWSFYQESVVSRIYRENDNDFGFKLNNSLRRIKGKFQFSLNQLMLSKNYNINDMGFQPRANLLEHSAKATYRIFEPKGWFNSYRFTFYADHQELYSPRAYSRILLATEWFFLTRNFFAFGANAEVHPVTSHDYFEPRNFPSYFAVPARGRQQIWISTDYRNPFALDVRFTQANWYNSEDYRMYQILFSPRYRFNDKLSGIFRLDHQWINRDIGWAGAVGDSVIFGRRYTQNTVITFNGSYIFNPVMSLSMNLRYVWNTIKYRDFLYLNSSGGLDEIRGNYASNLNFNNWNFDLKFSWWFAPASELVLLYRNALLSLDDDVAAGVEQNFQRLLQLPQAHNISFRLTYFLDYNYARKQLKRLGNGKN